MHVSLYATEGKPGLEFRLLRRGHMQKNKQSEPARPVSTDALASYSQGVSLSKDLGYKPQEQTSVER